MLADPSGLEADLLGRFHYQENEAVLHTDPQFMPRTRRCWASWNYRIDRGADGANRYSTHYWMNELQGVSESEQYFVSINPPSSPAPRIHQAEAGLRASVVRSRRSGRAGTPARASSGGARIRSLFLWRMAALWIPRRRPLVGGERLHGNSGKGPMAMNSLYECSVAHCRLKPKRHAFDYRVFMFCVDLDELPALGRGVFGFSHNRFNLFSIDDRGPRRPRAPRRHPAESHRLAGGAGDCLSG